jgi:hypothetical protein
VYLSKDRFTCRSQTPIYGTLSTNKYNYYNPQQSMTLLSSTSATRIRGGLPPPPPPPPPLKPKRTFEYTQPATTTTTKIINSSTTLDEEDLDLNDLKDFEDVTFDNLRKPAEKIQTNKIKNIVDDNNKNLLLLPKLIETAAVTHNDNKLYEETEI